MPKTFVHGYKTIAISAIKPWDKNPRFHSPAQVKQLAKSITEFGFTSPILVDEKGNLVAGHGRILAAKSLGMKTVPSIELRGLTTAQKHALAIADNQLPLNATWDDELLKFHLGTLGKAGFDLDVIGFSDAELAQLMGTPGGRTDPDAVPETPKKPVTRRGDIWLLGSHRLVCGDCTDIGDVQDVLGTKQAQCVFTSPPYAVGIDYADYEDTIANLRELLPKCAKIWHRFVVEGGFAVVNFGDVLTGRRITGGSDVGEYPMALEHYPVFSGAGWTLWSRRIWCKNGAAVGSSRHCIGSNRAASNFEHVWTWKRPGKPPVAKQIAGEWQSQAGWFESAFAGQLDVGLDVHGAGMPTVVAQRMIAIHTQENGIVLEPFSGTGTTIIACEVLKRMCAAVEISPPYVDVAVERWQAFTGKNAILNGTTRSFEQIRQQRHGKAKAKARAA